MSFPPNTTKPDAASIQVIISLGANLDSALGEPAATLQGVTERLRALAENQFATSALYQTTPVDCPPGTPDFLNSVVIMNVASDVLPRELLAQLHQLEADFGRVRGDTVSGKTNESRCLDLDLIAFGETLSHEPGLNLPHPRAHERQFVLQPLAELQPELVLPGQGRSVTDLLLQLPFISSSHCSRITG